ncbi:hypothetical protein GCM10009105_21500 [Dokdonella soli]|uniref:DUF58 domain-containing protein n=1 Tax=Dokdonella soli TaxID=529810 RepID=A0ABN1IJX9_9GAMM
MRARLRDLHLVARSGAGGDGLGQHASRSRGAGLEFAQYRAYEPGDEPRRIDWKLYARSDRYFVREAERDSPLTVWLILDATASMHQSDVARKDFSKLDAAKALAACVIELAVRQGDRFGVIALGGDAPLALPASAGARQRDRCLLELARLRCAGGWPDAASLRPLWERIAANALVLFFSDFFDEAAVALAERLAAARREVLTVQLLGADERDFPFTGGHRFLDPESKVERRVDASAARKDFLERFAGARAELARRLAVRGIRHTEHVLDEPLDAPLRRLFGAGLSPSPPTASSLGERAGVRGRGLHAEQGIARHQGHTGSQVEDFREYRGDADRHGPAPSPNPLPQAAPGGEGSKRSHSSEDQTDRDERRRSPPAAGEK